MLLFFVSKTKIMVDYDMDFVARKPYFVGCIDQPVHPHSLISAFLFDKALILLCLLKMKTYWDKTGSCVVNLKKVFP